MPITLHFPEIITTLKDIAIAGSAITGACVAVKGLTEWKKQHRWNEDRKLAKEIYSNLYHLKDATFEARSPIITSSEFISAVEGLENPKPEHDSYFQRFHVYRKRWNKVNNTRQTLYPQIIESQVLWGSKLDDLLKPLFSHVTLLFITIEEYLDSSAPNNPSFNLSSEEHKKNKKILYGRFNDKDDYYTKMNELYEPIEDYLRKKMGKKK